MVLIGIVVPFLLFFISMHSTYAYFTATAKEQKSTTSTAKIQIMLTEPEKTFEDLDKNIISAEFEGRPENQVLPGNTIYFDGTLLNKGTADCYILIQFSITITKVGSATPETHILKYYTFVEDNTNADGYRQQEITESQGVYSHNVGIIPKDNEDADDTSDERNFSFSFEIDGKTFTDAYQGATINYSIKAHALQTVHIPDNATGATGLLMQYINQ